MNEHRRSEYDEYLETRSNYEEMWEKFPCIEDFPYYDNTDAEMQYDAEDNDGDRDMESKEYDEENVEQMDFQGADDEMQVKEHHEEDDEQHVGNEQLDSQAFGYEAEPKNDGAREEDGIMWVYEPPTVPEAERSKYPKYIKFLECNQYANLPEQVGES